MNKILRFAVDFIVTIVIYCLVSFLFFGTENIGRTIFSAILFAVLCPITGNLLMKIKKNKEN
jgi:uncharacterized membrane protein YfbV (UPF0208 family)